MEQFFPENLLGDVFWDEPLLPTNQSSFVLTQPCPTPNLSAFVQYRDQPNISFGEQSFLKGSNSNNMNKRMIAFLRKSLPLERNKVAECERERGFKHMISERMRRQRQRQCCFNLHAVLPHGTKTDNNSVVQTAAKEIQRLQGCKEELERKNFVLEENVEVIDRRKQIQYLRVPCPTSGIDSIVETLKLLKNHGVDTRSIKSNFSQQELFLVLEIESEELMWKRLLRDYLMNLSGSFILMSRKVQISK
ncbi:transcription factor bHLH92 isoform X2 [Medicago truncatula]|uniref:transcription factor bHLH92 isoform X2 n=1 Tax=Medicago truncatula TaxID=3880 RepID=UPI000D2F1E1C|nr:transcription factor bHLH92 isoform X2 [Medicago truncatula]